MDWLNWHLEQWDYDVLDFYDYAVIIYQYDPLYQKDMPIKLLRAATINQAKTIKNFCITDDGEYKGRVEIEQR